MFKSYINKIIKIIGVRVKRRLLFIIIFILMILSYSFFVKSYLSEMIWNEREEQEVVVKHGRRDKKMIALTFDDGPHPRYTPVILDILKENDIKATFFVVGKHVKFYPDALKRIYDEGHEIGNHTYTHIDVKIAKSSRILDEINRTQDEIFSVVGIKPSIFRPPFGFYDKKMLKIAYENDYKIILWDADYETHDWENTKLNSIVKTILNNTDNGDIILLHDYIEKRSKTINALKIIIPELKRRGYIFVTVSKLIDYN